MKKRILSMLLAIVMIVTLVPVSALAKYRGDIKYAVTGGYIYFDTSRGAITDCDLSVTEAIIPASIGGYTVKEISDGFKDCTKLKSVTIPSSVTAINRPAFEGCTSLKKSLWILTTLPTVRRMECCSKMIRPKLFAIRLERRVQNM